MNLQIRRWSIDIEVRGSMKWNINMMSVYILWEMQEFYFFIYIDMERRLGIIFIVFILWKINMGRVKVRLSIYIIRNMYFMLDFWMVFGQLIMDWYLLMVIVMIVKEDIKM